MTTFNDTFICGNCFEKITLNEMSRNYYGEVLCIRCRKVGMNETLNEKKKRLIAERTEIDLQIAEVTKRLRQHLDKIFP